MIIMNRDSHDDDDDDDDGVCHHSGFETKQANDGNVMELDLFKQLFLGF